MNPLQSGPVTVPTAVMLNDFRGLCADHVVASVVQIKVWIQVDGWIDQHPLTSL